MRTRGSAAVGDRLLGGSDLGALGLVEVKRSEHEAGKLARERGVPSRQVSVSGYWSAGRSRG